MTQLNVERPPERNQAMSADQTRQVAPEDRIIVFDTTLRDGEQSPGASMTVAE